MHLLTLGKWGNEWAVFQLEAENFCHPSEHRMKRPGQDVKAQGAKTYANPDWFDDWSTPTPIREDGPQG